MAYIQTWHTIITNIAHKLLKYLELAIKNKIIYLHFFILLATTIFNFPFI